MGCAQSKPQVAPNLSIAPAGPSAPSLERKSTGRVYADALKTGAGASKEKEYDAYLSFETTAATLAAEVRSSLDGYQLPAATIGLKEKLATLRASRRVVIFLTPTFFSDERVAFGVFDSADFGSPQSRVRLIAGPPKLIRMLQGIPCARHVSIRDAFEKAGKELPRTGCLLQKPDSKPERRTHERGVGLKPRASPCVLGTFTGAVRPRSRASKPSTSPNLHTGT